jgi:hypothetical protein
LGLKLKSTGTLRNPIIRCAALSKMDVSGAEKQDITRMLKRALKTEEDLTEFYELARKDDVLRDVVKDLYGMHTVG